MTQPHPNRRSTDPDPLSGEQAPRKYSNVAAVSHELRAPLHAISGLAELLLQSDLSNSDRNLASSIHREAQALASIVSDLLELERADAGELQVVRDPFSPRLLVGEVISAYANNATAKGLQLTGHIDDEVPLALVGDRHRIRQILINLVSNAIKYTPTGQVTVNTSIVHGPTTRLRVAVADTGPGVPDEALPMLFEPFKQTRASDRMAGTGLGLPLTKRLIDLLDGTCVLDTSPAGSTFTIEIPVTPAVTTAKVEATQAAPASGRVLIVDDTEVNRLLAQAQLARLGYDSACAANGAEALAMLEAERFDAVLLDWHMPGMDGLEVTTTLRAKESNTGSRLPIILTTASVTDADRETCFDHDVSDFLPKPVSLSAMSDCLAKWVGQESAPTSDVLAGDDLVAISDDLIDSAVVDQLIADLGSPEIVIGVIDTFLGDTPPRLERLADQTTAVADCRREVHTLKTTAALLGAMPMSLRCGELEAAWTDGTSRDLADAASLQVLADKTLAALTVRRDQLRAGLDAPTALTSPTQTPIT